MPRFQSVPATGQGREGRNDHRGRLGRKVQSVPQVLLVRRVRPDPLVRPVLRGPLGRQGPQVHPGRKERSARWAQQVQPARRGLQDRRVPPDQWVFRGSPDRRDRREILGFREA